MNSSEILSGTSIFKSNSKMCPLILLAFIFVQLSLISGMVIVTTYKKSMYIRGKFLLENIKIPSQS